MRHTRADPLGDEESPVVAVEIPPEQVPPAVRGDEVVRLDAARLRVALAPRQVIEPERHPVAHGLRQRQQNVERHCRHRRLTGTPDRRHLDRVEPMPKPRRKHLTHRRESPDRGLTNAGTERRRRPQRDRDGERLVIIEQRRRRLRTRVEAVAPVGAHRRLDAVTHLAQTIYIAANGAIADIKS